MINILVVDDSRVDMKVLQKMFAGLKNFPHQVTHAESLERAFAEMGKGVFDIILLDLYLPDSAGLETVTRVVERGAKTAIVVLTGLEDETVGLEAIHKGAQDYVVKGQTDAKLFQRVINYAIERKKLLIELQDALANIKSLRGLIPICFRCKKIRNDGGSWDKLETYIKAHSNADFSHGVCPDCYKKEMKDLVK